jgi:hypothetical protein
LRRLFVEHRALVEPLDPRVEVGAAVDQALRGFRKLLDDRRVAVLGMAEAAFGPAALARRGLAALDSPRGKEPGDDVQY